MKKELIISTVDSRLDSAIKLAKSCFELHKVRSIIICQILSDYCFELRCAEDEAYELIYSYDKGLAKSRMLGILSSSADLLWLVDDDISIKQGEVVEAFKCLEESEYSFITTKYGIDTGIERKKYSDITFKHSVITVFGVSSIEVFINRNKVLSLGVAFDTRFGLGAHYKSGEENIFLADILKKGGSGGYVPLLTSMHPEITSGGDFEDDLVSYSKGAIFKRIFGWKGIFLLLAFFLKKAKEGDVKFKKLPLLIRSAFSGFVDLK